MSESVEQPVPIEERVQELESSRRRHMWVLILLAFTTCGYVQGRSTDVEQDNRDEPLGAVVRRLSDEVESLSTDVERLSNEVEDTRDELERVSERERNDSA